MSIMRMVANKTVVATAGMTSAVAGVLLSAIMGEKLKRRLDSEALKDRAHAI